MPGADKEKRKEGGERLKKMYRVLPVVILLIAMLIFPVEAGEQQEPVTVTQSIILE